MALQIRMRKSAADNGHNGCPVLMVKNKGGWQLRSIKCRHEMFLLLHLQGDVFSLQSTRRVNEFIGTGREAILAICSERATAR